MYMCKAFSCVIGRDKKVTWKFGTDSHEDLIKIAGYKDDTLDPEKIEFCRIEISPKNGSYLEPDEWVFKIDMDVTPAWWTLAHKRACEREHKKWMKMLDKVIVRKTIIHPFKITPPEKITEEHTQLVREWASVRDSVVASVWDSVRHSVMDSVMNSVMDSVRHSVMDSVMNSVMDSVRHSVVDSVRHSVWAYNGSFFSLKRSEWKYTERIDCEGYPFQPAVALWELGLVPSFDGKTWRLHGGPDGRVLWEGVI
jgi:hypothetical protein